MRKLAISEQPSTDGHNIPSNHLNRNRRALQFFLFAVAVDALLILVEFAAGISPLKDITRHPWLYGYIFLITMVSFSFFGAMIGWKHSPCVTH